MLSTHQLSLVKVPISKDKQYTNSFWYLLIESYRFLLKQTVLIELNDEVIAKQLTYIIEA